MRQRRSRRRKEASQSWVLQGQEKVLQGQEDLTLRNHTHCHAKNMKKDEDGGYEKLNQNNALVKLGMDHLNCCSRWPNCTRFRLFMPSGHFLLTGLAGHRAPLRLMREQEEYRKCKIKQTRRIRLTYMKREPLEVLISLPQSCRASSWLPFDSKLCARR